MTPQQFIPYTWKPTYFVGTPLRITYSYTGTVEQLDVVFPNERRRFQFTVDGGVAEVVIPAAELDALPDRAPARLEIRAGGRWETICIGHLTKRT